MQTARDITRALRGQWRGSYGMALCPAHEDGKEPALSICDAIGGDVVVYCFAGCDWRDIKDELRHRGLLPDWKPSKFNPERQARIAAERRKRDAEMREKDRRRREWCRSVWKESQEAQNSPVEVYLKGRGIDTLPPTIRCHAGLKHTTASLYFPCMVAAVTKWPSRELMGIHRTFLRPDGSGKADVEPAKMMAGTCSGGAVRLAHAAETLALCEGLETSMSVLQSTDIPVWAALSTSGMRGVILPLQVREVILCPDGDSPGEVAAREAAMRWKHEGRSVRIARPPRGFDFNDLLLGCAPRIEEDAA